MGPFYHENEHPLYSVLGENILPFSDRKLPKKAKKTDSKELTTVVIFNYGDNKFWYLPQR